MILDLLVKLRLVDNSFNLRKEVLEILRAVLLLNALTLQNAKNLLQERLLQVCLMNFVPSLEQECAEALDHDGLIAEQVFHLVERDVIWMVWRSETLRDEIV